VVAGSLLLGACGASYSGTTLSAQVSSWASSTGFTGAVSQLQGDLRRVKGYSSTPGSSWKTDCDVLVTDALDTNQNLPSPDQQLTDLLASAYSAAGDAGHGCFEGVRGAGLVRFTTERTTALRDLVKSLARYDALTTGTAS